MSKQGKKIIYIYVDKWNMDKIVYVGKDSYGHREKRHKEHLSTTRPTRFERALQKQPNRYKYIELLEVLQDDWLDDIEGILIWTLQKMGVAEMNQMEGLGREIVEVLNDTTTTK